MKYLFPFLLLAFFSCDMLPEEPKSNCDFPIQSNYNVLGIFQDSLNLNVANHNNLIFSATTDTEVWNISLQTKADTFDFQNNNLTCFEEFPDYPELITTILLFDKQIIDSLIIRFDQNQVMFARFIKGNKESAFFLGKQ